MTTTIPATEPTKIHAGDTVAWTRALADYLPADSWVLTYQLVNASQSIGLTATDNGDGSHAISVAPTVTDDWKPGDYQWQAYVTKAADRYTVGSGRITINANFAIAAATGADMRSVNKRTLDLVEAAIEDRFPVGEAGFSINGRSVELMTMAELLSARNTYSGLYARELRRERRAAGNSNASRIGVRL